MEKTVRENARGKAPISTVTTKRSGRCFVIALSLGLSFMLAASIAEAYTLSWIYSPSIEDGFRIARKLPTDADFSLLNSPGKEARTFTDPDRIPGTCYKLWAYNAFGESDFVQACANAPGAGFVLTLQ